MFKVLRMWVNLHTAWKRVIIPESQRLNLDTEYEFES